MPHRSHAGGMRVRDNGRPPDLTRTPKTMWIVAIAWMYVATMMALAEGTNPQGTWLGAAITFVLYGLAPMTLVMYLLGAPGRRKAIRAREQAEREAAQQQAAAAASAATPIDPNNADHTQAVSAGQSLPPGAP
jgi:hypothetical protein